MTQEQLTQFTRIYNTLMLISTKGEDTLIMADCLRAMQEFTQTVQIIEPNMSAPIATEE